VPLPAVLTQVAGIQAQYAPSMYIGLWSRVEGFERDDLTRALEQRSVVQGTLLRSTIHLVSAADYWPLAVAVGPGRREWWVRAHRGRPTADEVEAAAAVVKSRLAGEVRPRAELIEGMDTATFNGVGMWLDLVRVPPSGTWEHRRADVYAAAEDWLGPPGVSADDAMDLLVRRYLAGFGPATRTEIADWAGLPVVMIAPALERLKLRRFRAEDDAELLDLPRAPLPDAETPAPVRFLPTWDATLLVHARRTGILPEEHRPRVFSTKTPQSVPTFLVDGEVAGTWRYEKERVRIEPFGRLDRTARAELDEEAERLAAFHA
jgi:Winged helix DNA-binding domain